MSLRAWAARAGVAVAAATAISVGVTAGPSQAFVPPPPIPIIGGVVTAGAEAATAGAVACAASVLCAVGVGAIAVGTGLYMTRDTWIPWITGGSPPSGAAGVNGASAGNWSTTLMSPWTISADGTRGDVTITRQGITWASFGYNLVCSNGAAYATTVSAYNVLGEGGSSVWSVSCLPGSYIQSITTYEIPNDGGRKMANYMSWSKGGEKESLDTKYRVTVKCVLAGGGTQNIVLEYSGVIGGFKMPSCDAGGLVGSHGSGVKVEAQAPGATQWGTVYENNPTTNSSYPACQISSYDGRCVLEIYVNGSPCQVGASQCVDWMRRVQREGSTAYSCHWGPYTLPIARCDLLERAYEPGGSTITEPNTDGNPDTKTETTPNPTATAPGGSGVPDPSTWPGAQGTPQPGQDGGECFPSGWGVFNPVGWVVQPLKCVFIPSPSLTATRTAELRAQLDQVGVVPIINAVGGNFSALTASGCGGIPVDVTLSGQHVHMQFGEACSGTMATLATYTRALAAVVIVVAGGLAFIRLLSAAFGYNFTLGRGGGDAA